MTGDTSARVRLALSLGPGDVGARVMLRHRLPDGRATDVLGVLESWSTPGPSPAPAPQIDGGRGAGELVVRRGDGGLVTVAARDLLAAHRVPAPPRRARAADVADLVLEEVAALGWRAPQEHRLGGWVLRAAGGFTGRANSVLPLADPGVALDDALAQVCTWYAAQALPARFQVPMPACSGLDDALGARGWTAYNSTDVLVADVADVLADAAGTLVRASGEALEITGAPGAGWLGAYHYRGGGALPAGALHLFTSAPQQAFATVTREGTVTAIGRVALGGEGAGRRWAGLTALEVVAGARRRGLGTAVLRGLLGWAAQQGARHAYLQVAAENAGAHAAYARAGFGRHHGYHYRLQPAPAGGTA